MFDDQTVNSENKSPFILIVLGFELLVTNRDALPTNVL